MRMRDMAVLKDLNVLKDFQDMTQLIKSQPTDKAATDLLKTFVESAYSIGVLHGTGQSGENLLRDLETASRKLKLP